jgi:hypothetical protein
MDNGRTKLNNVEGHTVVNFEDVIDEFAFIFIVAYSLSNLQLLARRIRSRYCCASTTEMG